MRPKLREFANRVEALGGDDYIFDRVLNGDTTTEIMADFGLSRGMLWYWVRMDKSGERERRYREVRRLAAHGYVDDAKKILDDVADSESMPRVRAAESRAKFMTWLAGVVNREEYGKDQLKRIEIDHRILHLDALRQTGVALLPEGEAEVIDKEIDGVTFVPRLPD